MNVVGDTFRRQTLHCHFAAGHEGPHRTTTPDGAEFWFPA
jgi:hypothetical protein